MLTGTFSVLFLLCNLFLAAFAILPTNPPEKVFTSGAYLKAIVLDEKEKIDVSITYHLLKPPGSKQLTYAGLLAFDTHIQNVSVVFDQSKIELTPDLNELRIGGQINLPTSVIQDSTVTFDITYELTHTQRPDNQRFDIPIPLLWIENTNSTSRKDFFNAHLVVPEAYFIQESFPGNVAPCYSKSNTRHNCAKLQVLPTFIRVRGLIGHNPTFTVFKLLDYGMLFLLSATCIFIGTLLIRRTT